MTNDTETYTLAEAEIELAKRECARSGHDFRVWERQRQLMEFADLDPLGVQCIRCQRMWTFPA